MGRLDVRRLGCGIQRTGLDIDTVTLGGQNYRRGAKKAPRAANMSSSLLRASYSARLQAVRAATPALGG